MAGSWRGTVGVVKPNYTTGSLVEFIRLLPEGINVIPARAGLREYSVEGFRESLDRYKEEVAALAKLGVCDLIHPEGAPPFMVRGLAEERKIVQDWEDQYQVPVFTSGMVQVEALHALEVHRFVGFTFFGGPLPDLFARYFTDAGFDVAGMETLPERPSEWSNVSAEDIYRFIKRAFLKHSGAEGIYLLGSGSWRVRELDALEEDLGVPVFHPVAARIWYIQKQLHIHQPVPGAGRLLEMLP
jgi:maleate cis-trans isomerase